MKNRYIYIVVVQLIRTLKNVLMLIKKIGITVGCLLIIASILAQNKSNNLVQPPYLKVGDTIAIIAPAGILRDKEVTIDRAKKLAESWGLHVVYGKHLFFKNFHFAGTDEQRAADFQEALDNPNIKAIWAARGGYGSVRILDKLDFSKFKKHPKWIIGYSDITAFHNHFHTLGFETIHGMMPVNMTENNEEISQSISSLKKGLFGEALQYTIPSSTYNRNGVITGQLVGGNISILASMLGSESQLYTKDKILFIEEIGEYNYTIDRMLYSLKRAGYFNSIKGVVVGDISNMKNDSAPWGSTIETLILDIIPADIPVVFDFPAGHEADNRALIFGRTATLKVTKEDVSLTFK